MEVWKDIYFIEKGIEYDYRGKYQVSNLGNVKSLNYNKTKKEKILKQTKDKYGYLFVCLCKNGKRKMFKIHRLVAHMFCDGYFEGAEVDHIDTIKINNKTDNLRWVTSKENSNNILTKDNYSNANKGKNVSKLIERWSKDGKLLDIKYNFEYVELGFDSGNISSCCKGRLKKHKGFIFKYHTE